MTRQFDVIDYGAVPDGRTPASEAIRAAIGACAAARGGTVRFPPGTYLTGPIHMVSNLDLHVAAGATVRFSRDFDDYPMIAIRRESFEEASPIPPLFGDGLENISITGGGLFDGGGDAWRPVKRFKLTDQEWNALVASGGVVNDEGLIWWPTQAAMEGEKIIHEWRRSGRTPSLAEYGQCRDYLRPAMVCFRECKKVLIDGPTFTNPPLWTLNPLFCDDVTVRNVTVRNPWHAGNGDGLNPDSCRNVLIEHCLFSTGDDCIAVNSGRDEAGRRVGRPCENITIRHCRMERGHGGIVIGSGMSGGVRHVRAHDCTFVGTDNGLRFKSTRGRGGVVEDIRISDIVMSGLRGDAIRFNMYYQVADPQPEPVSEGTPQFRDFHVSNVTCDGAGSAMTLRGLPEMPVKAVTLQDVRVSADTGATLEYGRDITFSNVRIEAKSPPALRHRHVENLILDRFDSPPSETPVAGTANREK